MSQKVLNVKLGRTNKGSNEGSKTLSKKIKNQTKGLEISKPKVVFLTG
jgi:hypothetical protein